MFFSPADFSGSGCYEDYVPIKHWLDRAMAKYGGTYLEIEVEEVKVLLSTIPVFGFLVVYCILYYQVKFLIPSFLYLPFPVMLVYSTILLQDLIVVTSVSTLLHLFDKYMNVFMFW